MVDEFSDEGFSAMPVHKAATTSRPRSLLVLWPALRVALYEFFQYHNARNVLAAATVAPALFDRCTDLNDLLETCDSYFQAPHKPGYRSARDKELQTKELQTKETQTSHLFSEVLRRIDTLGDRKAARARLEEVTARLHFYIIGTTLVPVELQVPQEVTSLPEGPLAALQKAINRYRDGDFDGAMTALCSAVDGACEELAGHTVEKWTDLSFVQKVKVAHRPCMARLQALSGLDPKEITIISENNKRSISAAAEVLASFRRGYSDAHGINPTPAALVQIGFDSAVYLLRVLAPRPG
jgi:hypothetical protein